MIASWVEEELETIDLKDKRRNQRARIIVSQLSSIGESSPEAAKGKSTAALDALYRFVRNDAIRPSALLDPHIQSSIKRTKQYRRVVLAQDTTEVDLTKPQRQVRGAGPLSSNSRFGFYLHPLMAYNLSGVPLGIVACHHWTREKIDCESTAEEKKKQRNALPIEEKESFRWVEMIRRGKAIAAENPETEYVGVSDSESDVIEVFSEMASRRNNYHLLVRACQNRAVGKCEIDGKPTSARNIADALQQAAVLFCTKVDVRARQAKTGVEERARRKSRVKRTASMEVRAVSVTIRMRPAASSTDINVGKNQGLALNIVQAVEIDPPKGEEPITWTLITTLPIDTIEQVKDVIKTYQIRWNIEVYFMTLKSGMGIEKLQYRELDRYLNATTFLMIIAWRVQCLTKAGRDESSSSCEMYFQSSEWKAVWLVSNVSEPLPNQPPTLGEFMITVATLGGYVNRRQQGPPGVRTMWRGMRRLATLADAYRAFGPEACQRSGL
jgi:hypothetical protein